jgi:hypothetical protein
MGNSLTISPEDKRCPPTWGPTLIADRLISYEPDNIVIGICGNRDTSNDLTHQQIRVNSTQLSQLISFEEAPNKLSYKFDRGIALYLEKEGENVMYTIIDPSQHIHRTSEMHEINRKMFKNLSWGYVSVQFDKIGPFVKLPE